VDELGLAFPEPGLRWFPCEGKSGPADFISAMECSAARGAFPRRKPAPPPAPPPRPSMLRLKSESTEGLGERSSMAGGRAERPGGPTSWSWPPDTDNGGDSLHKEDRDEASSA